MAITINNKKEPKYLLEKMESMRLQQTPQVYFGVFRIGKRWHVYCQGACLKTIKELYGRGAIERVYEYRGDGKWARVLSRSNRGY